MSDTDDEHWKSLTEELRETRKDIERLRTTAPSWAFPYQGRKILLRSEVVAPIMQELTEINQALSSISGRLTSKEERRWEWLDFILDASPPPSRSDKKCEASDAAGGSRKGPVEHDRSGGMEMVAGCLLANCASFFGVIIALAYLQFMIATRKCV
jgi:hypothetical protein